MTPSRNSVPLASKTSKYNLEIVSPVARSYTRGAAMLLYMLAVQLILSRKPSLPFPHVSNAAIAVVGQRAGRGLRAWVLVGGVCTIGLGLGAWVARDRPLAIKG